MPCFTNQCHVRTSCFVCTNIRNIHGELGNSNVCKRLTTAAVIVQVISKKQGTVKRFRRREGLVLGFSLKEGQVAPRAKNQPLALIICDAETPSAYVQRARYCAEFFNNA